MKNQKRIIITLLLAVEVISVFLTWKSYNAGKILEDKVENNVTNEHFAFYIKENGEYREQTGNTFPIGYHIDKNMTVCVDENKEKLDNIPVTIDEEGKITVTSNRTVYCTFYLTETSTGSYVIDSQPSGLRKTTNEIDELSYRFAGNLEEVDNYICFGTHEKCGEYPNSYYDYLYQIIGITNDGQLKIIKTYTFESEDEEKLQTSAEQIFKETSLWENNQMGEDELVPVHDFLNDNFVNNEYFVPAGWKEKIEPHMWRIASIPTYNFTPIDIITADWMLEQEMNSPKPKTASLIGLPYLTDYFYSISNEMGTTYDYNWSEYFSNGEKWPYEVNWEEYFSWLLFDGSGSLTTLDTEPDNYSHSFYSYDNVEFNFENGDLPLVFGDHGPEHNFEEYLPTFFLKNDLEITGSGTLDNPFIIV